MAIKIKREPDVEITREEHDEFQNEYQKQCAFMVDPPSFETWVRRRKAQPPAGQ